MTTAKKDPTAAVAELEAKAESARAEASKLRDRLHQQQAQRRNLEAELAQLARREPGAFNEDGSARSEDARKLEAGLAKLFASRLPDVYAGAEDRAREAEEAVTACRTENNEYFARRVWDEGKEDMAELHELAAEMKEVLARQHGRAGRLTAICVVTQGLDGQDVKVDPKLDVLKKALDGLADAQPVRSESLTPLASEEVPRRLRVRSGGFVKSGHVDDLEGVRQPEKVAPA